MAVIPKWLIGRGVTTVTVTGESVATDGTLSDGTAYSLVGIWDELDLEFETEREEISAADAVRQNFVILKDIWRIRLVQILKNVTGGSIQNQMASAFYGGDVFKLTLQRGQQTWTIYCTRASYTENIRKGKSVGIFAADIVDGGAPTYA